MNRRSRILFTWLILGTALLLAQGCAKPAIYQSPDFQNIRVQHQQIAILPFTITIEAKKLPEGTTPEMLMEMEKDEGYQLQQQVYSSFLTKQSKGEYTIEFLDVDQTNAILSKEGITYETLNQHTKDEIAKLLSADVVFSGTVHRAQPMSTGAAVALGLLVGAWGSTNRVDVNVSIHDGSNAKLLWKYDHTASGSVGSSAEGLAKSLMESISKYFPYKVEKKKS